MYNQCTIIIIIITIMILKVIIIITIIIISIDDYYYYNYPHNNDCEKHLNLQSCLFCLSVECLHEEFARAGSDVLQAFTFYANDYLDKVSCSNHNSFVIFRKNKVKTKGGSLGSFFGALHDWNILHTELKPSQTRNCLKKLYF